MRGTSITVPTASPGARLRRSALSLKAMARNRMEEQARTILRSQGGTIDRPVTADGDRSFPLAYVRTGPRTDTPIVVLPGGPGLASVVPYRGFRKLAAGKDLDVLMIEHRGIGLSGRTADGRALPAEAVTVESAADDVAAVLDEVGAAQAIIVGSSYGSYLAQAVAVRHPDRVAALVLDSTMLTVEDDLAAMRAHRRRILWDGAPDADPDLAAAVRAVAEAGEPARDLAHVVQVVYEFAGPEILHRLLHARARGRGGRLWKRIAGLGAGELDGPGRPFFMELDPVAGIAFGQLGYGLPPDGGPLDPQLAFAEVAGDRPVYAGEPLDLPAAVPGYRWPTVVISGDRDLRTPRTIAERLVDLAPDAVLVPLDRTGHSVLDTHQLALVEIIRAVRAGKTADLQGRGQEISDVPRKGASRLVGTLITALVRITTRPVR